MTNYACPKVVRDNSILYGDLELNMMSWEEKIIIDAFADFGDLDDFIETGIYRVIPEPDPTDYGDLVEGDEDTPDVMDWHLPDGLYDYRKDKDQVRRDKKDDDKKMLGQW